MEPAQYTNPLEDALSHGSQRVAQVASLVAAMAQVVMQRRALEDARRATAADDPAARALDAQERALHKQARMSWAPAHDRQWLTRDLAQVASAWAGAAAWASTDPTAASALRKCEERLRRLHPFAMARYDRLRSDGLDPLTAMREAAPLFAYAPNARPGDPGPDRPALATPIGPTGPPIAGHNPGPLPASAAESENGDQAVLVRGQQIIDRLQARARAAGRGQLGPDDLAMILQAATNLPSDIIDRLTVQAAARAAAGSQSDQVTRTGRPRSAVSRHGIGPDATAGTSEHALSVAADSRDNGPSGNAQEHVTAGRTAVELAAESFPRTAADAVKAATGQAQHQAQAPSRTQVPRQAKRSRRSP